MLFKGQESLEHGWFRDDVDLDWSRLDSVRGIQRLYRDLISLRRNVGNNTRGLTGDHVFRLVGDDAHRLLAIHRWRDGGPGDHVVVLCNCSAQDVPDYWLGFLRPGMQQVVLSSAWTDYSEDFEHSPVSAVDVEGAALHGKPCSGSVAVAAYSAVILSQDA